MSENKMNQKEFIQLCKDWNTTPPTQKQIDYAKENDISVSCNMGNWYPNKNEFHYWKITHSSEDKGYCSY